MTFTEAAVEVLRREGKPLHFKKITEIAIRENLLDHVGKIPEEVMADQVAAHCRLPHGDRRILPVQHGTFALVEWGLDEDPLGLENLIELPPVDDVPYRARERHPSPAREMARVSGRGEKGRRREEGEERRGRRFPPPAEVAYEILAGSSGPLTLAEIAAQGAERAIMPDHFVRDAAALASALGEDNRRREAAGRRALFQVEGETVTLIAQPEPGERAPAPGAPRPSSPADLRRAGLAALRRRLRDCDPPTFEHVVAKLLEKLGYRDLKVAKRGREHVIYTGRKRLGLAEVRHCFRVVRTGAEAGRRDVTDTRRDLGHYGAQIGVVLSAGDAAGDARGEAGAAGQLPVLLLCGEALAEAFADAALGCVPVAVPDVDEPFFAAATEAAAREESARRARREERERREGEEREPRRERREERRDERRAPAEKADAPEKVEPVEQAEPLVAAPVDPAAAEATAPIEAAEPLASAVPPPEASGDDGDDEEGDEEEGEEEAAEGEAAAGPGGEAKPGGEGGRRRRRRRRRRGGRGRGERREGAPGAGGEAPQGGAPAEAAPAGGAEPSAPPPPPPPPSGTGGPGEA
jgi:hypothetical protein